MSECDKIQLNVQVSSRLYREVKKAAVDGHLKLRKLVQGFLWLGLYFKENLGVTETLEAVKHAEPLACLLAARNDLANRGFDTSRLNEVIDEVKLFLEASENHPERRNENECSETRRSPADR